MASQKLLYISIIALVLFGFGLIAFLKLKSRMHTSVLYFAFVMAALHLLLVVINAISIWHAVIGGSSEALLGWVIFDMADFPSSLLLLVIDETSNNLPSMVRNYWLPFAFFAIVGTLQYFAIGTGLGYLAKRLFAH